MHKIVLLAGAALALAAISAPASAKLGKGCHDGHKVTWNNQDNWGPQPARNHHDQLMRRGWVSAGDFQDYTDGTVVTFPKVYGHKQFVVMDTADEKGVFVIWMGQSDRGKTVPNTRVCIQ